MCISVVGGFSEAGICFRQEMIISCEKGEEKEREITRFFYSLIFESGPDGMSSVKQIDARCVCVAISKYL